MLKIACAVALMAAAHAAAGWAQDAPRPGQLPPRELQERLKPALEAEAKALAAMDEAGVRSAVARAVAVLGAWAGNPEYETRYFPPVDRAPFEEAKVRTRWLDQISRGQRKLPWRSNPAGDPRRMQAGLRAAAIPLQALARTLPLAPERKDELLPVIRAGADWLLALQHESGVFPMPVGPSLEPGDKVGHILERMLRERPELAVNGWIADVPGDGGLQFDHGLCGTALVAAWNATRDERYLAAAKRAADWAARQPLVPNWNYNAFSVGLLASVAGAARESRHLAAAVAKARVGVLPGQMANGRWFDPHNASAVYHDILLRDLLSLWGALPADDAFRGPLRDSLVRGLDQAAGETLANGCTGTWTGNFARALMLLGESRAWRDALNASVNAALAGRGPGLGFASVPVLECAAKNQP